MIQEPTAEWLNVPQQDTFAAPPSNANELQAFVAAHRKELKREDITLDREIGMYRIRL